MHQFFLRNGGRIDILDGEEWKKLDEDFKNWNRLDLNAGGSYKCKPNGESIFVRFCEIYRGSSSPDVEGLDVEQNG